MSRDVGAERLAHLLQWGRSFSAAEITVAMSVAEASSCFNGAAAFQLRKSVYEPVDNSALSIASMGPQLFSCGNVQLGMRRDAARQRFNGAAAFQLRKYSR